MPHDRIHALRLALPGAVASLVPFAVAIVVGVVSYQLPPADDHTHELGGRPDPLRIVERGGAEVASGNGCALFQDVEGFSVAHGEVEDVEDEGRSIVTVDGRPWQTAFSVLVFMVLLAVAVRIAWREWRPDFEAQYGEARGREFLALFLISFPAFVVVHLMDKHARRRKTPPDDR